MNIRVGHLIYSVLPLPEADREEFDGRCNFTKRELHLHPDKQPAEQAEVLIHELLHAMYEWCDLPKTNEERIVRALANGLSALFVDNPELFATLHGGLSRNIAII